MLRNTQLFLVLLCALPLLSPMALAQEEDGEKSKFFVLNQNQVDMADLPKMWDLYEQSSTVLQELQDEGKIVEFGVLQHAWGDEWNWNFYIIADSHESFLSAWKEFFSRSSEKYPEMLKQWVALVKAHKDNMYTLYR